MSFAALTRFTPATLAAAVAAASVAVAAGPVRSQTAQLQRERAAAARRAAVAAEQDQVSQLQRLLDQDLQAISNLQAVNPQAGGTVPSLSLPSLPPVSAPAVHATTGASGLG